MSGLCLDESSSDELYGTDVLISKILKLQETLLFFDHVIKLEYEQCILPTSYWP